MDLTKAGQIYYARCRRIVHEARLAHEQLGELLAQPSGVSGASLPVDYATIYMAPLITESHATIPASASTLTSRLGVWTWSANSSMSPSAWANLPTRT